MEGNRVVDRISQVLDRFFKRDNRVRLGLNVAYRASLNWRFNFFKNIKRLLVFVRELPSHVKSVARRRKIMTQANTLLARIGLRDPFLLKVRYRKTQVRQMGRQTSSGSLGLLSCDVFFINLDRRLDRLASFQKQLGRLGLEGATRVSARSHTLGALGCAMSHLDILSHNKTQPDRLLMVCEDDCEFLMDKSELDEIIREFHANTALDVLCLAYNTTKKNKVVEVSERLAITSDTQTTACYILKPHMVKPMMHTALRSVAGLQQTGDSTVFAIDIVWKALQQTTIFSVPLARAAIQSESYSDIEQKITNYGV